MARRLVRTRAVWRMPHLERGLVATVDDSRDERS
jgi:hypothetical protein